MRYHVAPSHDFIVSCRVVSYRIVLSGEVQQGWHYFYATLCSTPLCRALFYHYLLHVVCFVPCLGLIPDCSCGRCCVLRPAVLIMSDAVCIACRASSLGFMVLHFHACDFMALGDRCILCAPCNHLITEASVVGRSIDFETRRICHICRSRSTTLSAAAISSVGPSGRASLPNDRAVIGLWWSLAWAWGP